MGQLLGSPARPFQQSVRTASSVSRGGRGVSGKMFFVTGAKSAGGASSGGGATRSIYQKFRDVDLLDKKTVTALKAGEDRAILLGLAMVIASIMMYFVLGITILRSYASSVWTEESVCIVVNSTITADVNCSYSCGSDCWRGSKYPCLQVYVSVNTTGRLSRLSHNEESWDSNFECFYVPKCQKDTAAMHHMIVNISERLKPHQQVPCYYDPSDQQESALLTRLYGHSAVFYSLFWPSCMLTGGTAIIFMVKLTQYLSIMCEQVVKIKR
ncbi:calcium-activated potassium channel subunit beta-2-like [Salvelinus namaycush]|uniref:Calcium-activated potassium channel subunit beta-2-like n=1 Tax=Salvelinus namaycush TaxID=8040 RepID=A0A8U1C1K1_SALNM|nr:calcium-activated potassium channel subunit beta-2-like [Salvelinus namaycush]